MQILLTTGRIVLPPTVAAVRAVVAFYAVLPMDVLLAQAGLVYCFDGGHFPTLFAALQAAEHCGRGGVGNLDRSSSRGSKGV